MFDLSSITSWLHNQQSYAAPYVESWRRSCFPKSSIPLIKVRIPPPPTSSIPPVSRHPQTVVHCTELPSGLREESDHVGTQAETRNFPKTLQLCVRGSFSSVNRCWSAEPACWFPAPPPDAVNKLELSKLNGKHFKEIQQIQGGLHG